MEEEVKKVSLSWSEKGVPDYDISFTYDTLLCIDKALVECNEILGEAGLGTGYESRQTTILKLEEDYYTLNRYSDVSRSMCMIHWTSRYMKHLTGAPRRVSAGSVWRISRSPIPWV